ncbi:hypothetical protein FBY31_0618 [Arthrobacter sp. SLBN-100]|uniref:hypothetical protein n=1 Tax=Arthrobacter sp. SLBN-100 TaxID=2768450 RepID=UPI00114FF275|nr:hypothetical protein [Arthrobacter sp. SLBN-100]TQJ66582.1 hypothetical protein FBY31_0618 [Arthrobacter sp. SLBN-100]
MDLPSIATEYTLTPTGTDLDTRNISSFCVRVQRRGLDQWALLSHGQIWNGTDWQYDYPAHEQDKDFSRLCLRDLKTAGGCKTAGHCCRCRKDLGAMAGGEEPCAGAGPAT